MSFKVNALVLAAVAALTVGVAGCGGDDKKGGGDVAPQPAATAEAAPTDTAAPAATGTAAPAQ